MKTVFLSLFALVVACLLGACSSLPSGEPEADMPIYGSSTPR